MSTSNLTRVPLGLSLVSLIATSAGTSWAAPCPSDRYVGIVPVGSTCPGLFGAWTTRRLFPDPSMPDELARYCVFTGGGSPATLPNFGHDTPVSDCAVAAPLGVDFSAENQVALEASFREQVEELSSLPSTTLVANPTKVIVVDSSKAAGFPLPSDGLIDHGLLVGAIVRELGCPPGSPVCASAVASTLALPMLRSGAGFVRDPNGGRFGSMGDIAAAVMEAALQAGATPGPTVINLSVGWDRTWGGPYSGSDWTTLSPPIRAVHQAITYASCRGALVLAAAGNKAGGPSPTLGASFPAAWEGKPAPTATRCDTLVGSHPRAPATTNYARLVYAVAGLDPRDTLVANAREGSVPPLVAPADHATITDSLGQTTSIYTGSSVAAAVASAAAAAMWRYRPGLVSHELVNELRASAVPLPGKTVQIGRDGCAAGCPNGVGRISFCRAIATACTNGGACSAPPCPNPVSPRDLRPDLTFTFDNSQSVEVQGAFSPAVSAAPLCGGDYYPQPNVALTCPSEELMTNYARPFAGPQTGSAVCVTCKASDLALALDLDPGYANALYSPALKVTTTAGREETIPLAIDQGSLELAGPFEVYDLPISSLDMKSATIEFKVDFGYGPYSTSDPLIIDK